jgi:hypothetical protein
MKKIKADVSKLRYWNLLWIWFDGGRGDSEENIWNEKVLVCQQYW